MLCDLLGTEQAEQVKSLTSQRHAYALKWNTTFKPVEQYNIKYYKVKSDEKPNNLLPFHGKIIWKENKHKLTFSETTVLFASFE